MKNLQTTAIPNNIPEPELPTEGYIIEVENLAKAFGEKKVLTNLSLKVKKGENVVIVGKSGEGKSVAIKCIIGMIEPDAGTVMVLGNSVFELSTDKLKELRQKIGFLFQSGALYDSMTVQENLEFSLKRVLHIKDQAEIDSRTAEVLEAVGLADAKHKMPSDLSGGMRKRIALARTLVVHPTIILYDEPTTGLDAITSREISELILQMQKKYRTTSIIITHDMKCAAITADRILIMKAGVFIAEGDYAFLQNSKDKFIASFFE